MPSEIAELRARLPGLMLRDQRRLGRRVGQAAGLRERGGAGAGAAPGWPTTWTRPRPGSRPAAGAVPELSYPPELPVSQRKDEIAAAIRDHQVVIVAGETGSGKTTQLPKICLELGRGVAGQIGHTQPRRIAARTVAERIAEELGTELGAAVGYKVRFTDTSSDGTLVKVMTDGILLTEMQRDRQLLRYDTLIIDEAHERSLNIDFILGYLKRLLPTRPDLKVIITSATIDPERFSKHFGGRAGDRGVRAHLPGRGALPAAGRPGPARRRAAGPGPGHLRRGGRAARRGPGRHPGLPQRRAGDQGHRRRAGRMPTGRPGGAAAVRPAVGGRAAPGVPAAPRPARGAGHQRRRDLADRARHQVRDRPGHRADLPVQPPDQGAAAADRADLAGLGQPAQGPLRPHRPTASASGCTARRTSPRGRSSPTRRSCAPAWPRSSCRWPRSTSARSRTSRSSTRRTPATSPTASGCWKNWARSRPGRGGRPELTDVGRKLARLPLDPRLGRMILEAGQHGCAREVLIITAALSIQDPRERPADAREAADAKHARFAEPGSDFLAFLTLWDYLRDQQRELSGSAFRRLCRREYLHYLRVREWQDVYGQLRQAARDLGIGAGRSGGRGRGGEPGGRRRAAGSPASEPRSRAGLADRVHMSLLAGLLSHIGMQDVEQQGRGRGKRRAAGRVRRGPRRPVRDLPRLRAGQEAAAVGRGRRAGRDLPAVGQDRGQDRARVGRAAGRAPGQAQLQRAALGRPARRGDGAREGHPVRPADRGRAAGQLRRGSTRRRRASCSSAAPWSRATGRPTTGSSTSNRRLLDEAEDLERRARRRGIVADDAALFDFYDRADPGRA